MVKEVKLVSKLSQGTCRVVMTDQADNGRNDVFGRRVNDATKSRSDDYSHSQIDYVSTQNERLESLIV